MLFVTFVLRHSSAHFLNTKGEKDGSRDFIWRHAEADQESGFDLVSTELRKFRLVVCHLFIFVLIVSFVLHHSPVHFLQKDLLNSNDTMASEDESFDAVFESGVVEIDQKPDLDSRQFHVCQQLRFVNSLE